MLIMPYIAKRCRGCQSSMQQSGMNYYKCFGYVGFKIGIKGHKLFRDKFCPCADCVVKGMCTDPKLQQIGYSTDPYEEWDHKCKLLMKHITEFREYIKEKKGNEHNRRRSSKKTKRVTNKVQQIKRPSRKIRPHPSI